MKRTLAALAVLACTLTADAGPGKCPGGCRAYDNCGLGDCQGNGGPGCDCCSGEVSYAELYRRVKAGGRGVLFVGVPPRHVYDPITAKIDSLPGFAAGEYVCTLGADGLPKMTLVRRATALAAAPGVAAPTFPGFDPDHTCDRCGRSQFVVERFLPTGRHVHTCGACGHSWQH